MQQAATLAAVSAIFSAGDSHQLRRPRHGPGRRAAAIAGPGRRLCTKLLDARALRRLRLCDLGQVFELSFATSEYFKQQGRLARFFFASVAVCRNLVYNSQMIR